MRHSERYPILDQALNYSIGLTEQGVRLAEELGAHIKPMFRPGRLLSSPVGRCLDTANAIARGAGWPQQARADTRLSHEAVGSLWLRVASGQVSDELPEPVREALSLLLGDDGGARLDVMVTHDTVLGVVANTLLNAPVIGPHWPDYLEGLLAWREGQRMAVRWRGTTRLFQLP